MSRIAVLGTGLTGAPIAVRLAAQDDEVAVWNRTRAKAEALRPQGIEVAATPAEAVAGADAVLLCLLDEEANEAVLAQAEPGFEPRTLVLDLSTTSVAAASAFAERVARPAKAPFFGSVPEAERGALFFVVGCRDKDWNDVQAVLAPLGEVFHVGDVATAAALKLALNVLVYPMVENIAESIALARGQGIDPELVLAALARGTGVRAPIYLGRGRLIVDGDYDARATVELARKDLALIAQAAQEAGLRLPLVETAREVFERAGAAQLDGEDMAAVAKLL